MVPVKITPQDQRELEKFIRFFVYKIVQVVVQSRLGTKVKTLSTSEARQTDWFNFVINDLPDVQKMTTAVLNGQLPKVDLGLCVEMVLRTSEGDDLVLEIWYLTVNDKTDEEARVNYTVHSAMGTVLKSLLVMTRITPAYKLSQMQGKDTYVMCYSINLGEPNISKLGDGYKKWTVGDVVTPLGTYSLNVAYRMQLTITHRKINRESAFMLKSDHFKPDMSPKSRRTVVPLHNNRDKNNTMDQLAAACEDVNGESCQTNLKNGEIFPSDPLTEEHVQLNECLKDGAFVTGSKAPVNEIFMVSDPAFVSLLEPKERKKTVKELNILNKEPIVTTIETELKPKAIITSCMEDFVIVDLKPPFACGDDTDLSVLIRECQTAPQLMSFSQQPSLAEQVDELGLQLDKFETSVPDLDSFVETLCLDENSK